MDWASLKGDEKKKLLHSLPAKLTESSDAIHANSRRHSGEASTLTACLSNKESCRVRVSWQLTFTCINETTAHERNTKNGRQRLGIYMQVPQFRGCVLSNMDN